MTKNWKDFYFEVKLLKKYCSIWSLHMRYVLTYPTLTMPLQYTYTPPWKMEINRRLGYKGLWCLICHSLKTVLKRSLFPLPMILMFGSWSRLVIASRVYIIGYLKSFILAANFQYMALVWHTWNSKKIL